MTGKKFTKLVQEYMFQIIVCLVGILGTLLCFFIPNERIFSVCSGVFISLVASAVVAVGSLVVFRKVSTRKEICDYWELDAIYELRQEANKPLNEYQDKARHQIDIVALGLSSWLNARSDKIIDALKHGVKIRIITANPNNQFLLEVDKSERKLEGATSRSIQNLQGEVFKYKKYGNIEIKLYDGLPLDMYFRVDNHIITGPNMRGRASQQTRAYEFSKGGKGFDYYEKYFEMLWESIESTKQANP